VQSPPSGVEVGPSVGGFLGQPVPKFKEWLSRDGILAQFPYALPCIIVTLCYLVSLVLVYLWLPESVNGSVWFNSKNIPEYLRIVPRESIGEMEEDKEIEMRDLYDNFNLEAGEEDESVEDKQQNQIVLASNVEKKEVDIKEEKKSTEKAIFGAIGSYLLCIIIFEGWHTMFPFWCITNVADGGLSMSVMQVSWLLLFGGIAFITCQGYMYPWLATKFKFWGIFRIGGVCAVLALLLMPIAHNILELSWDNPASPAEDGLIAATLFDVDTITFIFLAILVILLFLTKGFCFTSANILISLAAPVALGKAYGLTSMLSSLVKTLLPSISTGLLAWSLTNSDQPFPLNYPVVFVLLAVVAFVGVLGSFVDWHGIKRRN